MNDSVAIVLMWLLIIATVIIGINFALTGAAMYAWITIFLTFVVGVMIGSILT